MALQKRNERIAHRQLVPIALQSQPLTVKVIVFLCLKLSKLHHDASTMNEARESKFHSYLLVCMWALSVRPVYVLPNIILDIACFCMRYRLVPTARMRPTARHGAYIY